MSYRVNCENVLEAQRSGWCDAGYLAQNQVASREETFAMLNEAERLGFKVLQAYEVCSDPRAGEYPVLIDEPRLVSLTSNLDQTLAEGWTAIFDYIRATSPLS